MDNKQRNELLQAIDNKIGLDNFFLQLGIQDVSRSGKKIYMVCPFHEGADNPTGFCWNIDKGFGYCFTQCHQSYSIFDVVMKIMGLEFCEAVTYISDLIGISIDLNSRKKFDGNDNRTFLSQVKKAKSFVIESEIEPFEASILNTFIPRLHTKLRKEGFDEEVREYFGLGFCQSGYLENRITIPIDSIDGSIISVSGRSVLSQEELEYGNIQKYKIYYNTDKSKTLYNISRALPYIELLNEVIVVEGFKSVWRLHQWGIRNAVAVMGSTISQEQIMILLKLNAKIIACGDRDEAGQILNQRVIEGVKKFADVGYMNMYILNVPEKSSISDITQQQYEYLYQNRKEVI